MKQQGWTQRLMVSGVMIALATVLSMVKIWTMPLGGSVTLCSMVPLVFVSLRYGVKWGIFVSLLYALLQILIDLGALMSWGLTPWILIGSLVFDYLLAYGILGLSGLFRGKGTAGICLGICLALTFRFLFHFLSGVIVMGTFCPEGWNVWFYSLCYNGSFMLPELIVTTVVGTLLFRLPFWKRM